ncbi:Bug family tripartite tricarboxylate transporter substrate binding protein [Comamonas thiooxydans]|uniref:Bug family tripartite tricarboxylate transporter substrate binding protein n=1 Tax=Comamonas thiooxydans TaxID=363952 RepID=UPI0006A81A2D|nr:Bug family tripartite tricarboxylate transporter substrate binding protein [Comamonas thiooxydans]CUB01710.1 Tripartite-type tricarboxylate transporter, receptor component TctC [Comamonas thiooxydans]
MTPARNTCMRRAACALLASVLAATLALSSPIALAREGNRTKPIKLLVGFSPGGGTDVVARYLADKLREELHRSVIVENRPGAGGQVAAQALKAAPKDGSTLFFTNDHTISIIPLVMKQPGFNTSRDFTPVAGVAIYVSALFTGAGTPVKSYAEYIRWVHDKQAGKGSVGIPAPASLPEFMTIAIGARNTLDLTPVPYKGAAPMLGDIMGNQILAGISSLNDVLESQKAGKINVLAVSGRQRHAGVPDTPTFSELGVPGFEESPFYAIYAPQGMPPDEAAAFSQAMQKVLARPEVRERMVSLGLIPQYLNPEQMRQREQTYAQTWGKLIKDSGYQPQ